MVQVRRRLSGAADSQSADRERTVPGSFRHHRGREGGERRTGLGATAPTVPANYSRLSAIARFGKMMDATHIGQILAPWQRKLTTSPSATLKD
jgi:hypothetical protein